MAAGVAVSVLTVANATLASTTAAGAGNNADQVRLDQLLDRLTTGGIISSGADMNRFLGALVDGRLRTRPTGDSDGRAYGLGLEQAAALRRAVMRVQ